MEVSTKCCRLCLSETDFCVPLFNDYCCRNNTLEKINVCLNLTIKMTDPLTTICYACAYRVDMCYDFITTVKKCQTQLNNNAVGGVFGSSRVVEPKISNLERQMTSYVLQQQVVETDYIFSFLDPSDNEKKQKTSSPFFSYFLPSNDLANQSEMTQGVSAPTDIPKRDRLRRHSKDLFESESQDTDEPKTVEWKLSPDNNIMKRIRKRCFGPSDF